MAETSPTVTAATAPSGRTNCHIQLLIVRALNSREFSECVKFRLPHVEFIERPTVVCSAVTRIRLEISLLIPVRQRMRELHVRPDRLPS